MAIPWGTGGGGRPCAPHFQPNFFDFHPVFIKNYVNIRLTPPSGVRTPPGSATGMCLTLWFVTGNRDIVCYRDGKTDNILQIAYRRDQKKKQFVRGHTFVLLSGMK